jgi:hypothetical protein
MTVVVPAGLPILDAARWVGESCWLELHVYEVVTELLASEVLHDDQRVALWKVRSNRAEVAEAWHRRLPELREFPRHTFVSAPDGPLGEAAAEPTRPLGVPVVAAWLSRLKARYVEHLDVAVGPADGPVAGTLRWALALLAQDLEAVATRSHPPEGWSESLPDPSGPSA